MQGLYVKNMWLKYLLLYLILLYLLIFIYLTKKFNYNILWIKWKLLLQLFINIFKFLSYLSNPWCCFWSPLMSMHLSSTCKMAWKLVWLNKTTLSKRLTFKALFLLILATIVTHERQFLCNKRWKAQQKSCMTALLLTAKWQVQQ